MIECRNLELHVSHACNLKCESCSHFSNQGHKGTLDLPTARRWLSTWSRRLAPAQFALLGGEPAVNPRLADFVWLAAESFPDSNRIVVSNGFLLARHSRLPVALAETDTTLHVSIHHTSAEYQAKLASVRQLLAEWERRWGIRVNWRESAGRWERVNRGRGSELLPFADGAPAQSWHNCRSRDCLQLHNGKLWKCPAAAYLGVHNERWPLGKSWQPYLAYQPLAATCDDETLRAFVAREAESVCGMCPARPELFDLPNPLPAARPAAGGDPC